MNRCRISVAVLVALVVLCVSSLFLVRHWCRDFYAETQNVEAAVVQGDTAAALAAYDALLVRWDGFHDRIGLFIDGSKLDPVYELLSGLRPLIAQEHPEVQSELRELRALVEELMMEEIPVVWHIL